MCLLISEVLYLCEFISSARQPFKVGIVIPLLHPGKLRCHSQEVILLWRGGLGLLTLKPMPSNPMAGDRHIAILLPHPPNPYKYQWSPKTSSNVVFWNGFPSPVPTLCSVLRQNCIRSRAQTWEPDCPGSNPSPSTYKLCELITQPPCAPIK